MEQFKFSFRHILYLAAVRMSIENFLIRNKYSVIDNRNRKCYYIPHIVSRAGVEPSFPCGRTPVRNGAIKMPECFTGGMFERKSV